LRRFSEGEKYVEPYSDREKPSEPRSFWKLHIFEMSADGKLVVETRDFWEEIQKFYGTSDLKKMQAKNTWEIQKAVFS
jgi:hypothetical protein